MPSQPQIQLKLEGRRLVKQNPARSLLLSLMPQAPHLAEPEIFAERKLPEIPFIPSWDSVCRPCSHCQNPNTYHPSETKSLSSAKNLNMRYWSIRRRWKSENVSQSHKRKPFLRSGIWTQSVVAFKRHQGADNTGAHLLNNKEPAFSAGTKIQ